MRETLMDKDSNGHNFKSYDKALTDCRIESLATRRTDHCRKFAEVLADNKRTKDLIPPRRLEVHPRMCSHTQEIPQLRFRTTRFKKSPTPSFH